QNAGCRHRRPQPGVAARVDDVEAAADDADGRRPGRFYRALVGGAVDSQSEARDHAYAGSGQVAPQLAGDVAPVAGAPARAHDGDPRTVDTARVAGGEEDGRGLAVGGQRGRIGRIVEEMNADVGPRHVR